MAINDYQAQFTGSDIKSMTIDFFANLSISLIALSVLIIFIFLIAYLVKKR